jgi:hypothetical protein
MRSPTKRIWSGFSLVADGLARLAGFAFRAGWWGRAAARIEHGIDELGDGALVGGRELLDALEPLEEPGGPGTDARRGRREVKVSFV